MRAFNPQKRTSTSKYEISFLFSTFADQFCPTESASGPKTPDAYKMSRLSVPTNSSKVKILCSKAGCFHLLEQIVRTKKNTTPPLSVPPPPQKKRMTFYVKI